MIQLRKANDRGHADHGWLRTFHSFSFADYHDPAEMGWGVLRVINEDFVAPDTGFGTHGHRDMEIITYLLSGTLQHRDSMNNSSVIRPGEVQRMSAGEGVQHSEFNPSNSETVHFLQLWIEPNVFGCPPEYEQKTFPDADKRDRLCLLASPDGDEGSLSIHQDARLFASLLTPETHLEHKLALGRRAYLHVVRGAITLNGLPLGSGDGAKIKEEAKLSIVAKEDAEILMFDLPTARR